MARAAIVRASQLRLDEPAGGVVGPRCGPGMFVDKVTTGSLAASHSREGGYPLESGSPVRPRARSYGHSRTWEQLYDPRAAFGSMSLAFVPATTRVPSTRAQPELGRYGAPVGLGVKFIGGVR